MLRRPLFAVAGVALAASALWFLAPAPDSIAASLAPAAPAALPTDLSLAHPLDGLGGRQQVDDPAAREEAFAELRLALSSGEFERAGALVHDWLLASEDPVGLVLAGMSLPDTDRIDADIWGILLQTLMQQAVEGSAFTPGWGAAEIAGAALELCDANAFSGRTLLVGLERFGSAVPGSMFADHIVRSRGGDLVHAGVQNQMWHIKLIRAWAEEVIDADEPLVALALDAGGDSFSRSTAANCLLRRDWRHFGPIVSAELANTPRGPLTESLVNHLVENLSGLDLELPGREHLELLREVIDHDTVSIYALSNLSPEEANLLAYAADDGDREWEHFEWVRFRAGGVDSVQAGLRLLDQYEGHENPFLARGVMQELLAAAPDDPHVQLAMEERFMRRFESGDVFWSGLAHNLQKQPVDVLQKYVRTWLQITRGETHPSRARVLHQLRQLAPDLADGLT